MAKEGLGAAVIFMQRHDGLFDAFIPAPPGYAGVVNIVQIPGKTLPCFMQTVTREEAIGMLLGTCAGLAGKPVHVFIDALCKQNEKVKRQMGLGGNSGVIT